ncbi:MAG: cation:proton antiporter, partial [Chloroflexota bacterium]|nr:cation:proton antiporter [Chloroflexota bacterium]
MLFNIWFVIIGALLISVALAGSVMERLPLTSAMFYMALGVVLGPVGFGLIQFDPVAQAGILERLTEVVVIISLFSAGLKLRTPLHDGRWRLPVRLAFISMTVTVGLIALAGVTLLGLPIGAAVLLGAALAPTDPVLASDVQVRSPTDRDRLRFSLTGEAGLNDGTAFPFVMLGVGLLGLHELG